MNKSTVLLYGIVNYLIGSASLVALIAFTFNFLPENPLLSNIDGAGGVSGVLAALINLSLMTLFAVQHSVMARRSFKEKLERILPPAAERSTFLMGTALVLFLMMGLWQPLNSPVWMVEEGFVYFGLLGIGLAGWGLVFYATFLINHFDLFGLRQTWLYFRGVPYTHVPFQLSSLYRYIRHPIMTGVFLGIWFTPEMTVGHLMFALGMSAYILIGVAYEERDLIKTFGERYLAYRADTGRFLPVIRRSNAGKSKAV
ncbi:MAG: isoprenylcysteine carboxylmethyltransferase family protein [Chromatiaceae bacterium]|nr:isoprenylcysteine carboxylmethyltransferase family protein [Chromatiaceae bacterium]MCP5438582.1 isoprenylcysteine carboxylmethyltransferase family protein [Chromatiaceae bacterium]MCP5440551.1 isoprenylcysteine carboxylmethyltransferase family protein [Chromatiaceae bacterium]